MIVVRNGLRFAADTQYFNPSEKTVHAKFPRT